MFPFASNRRVVLVRKSSAPLRTEGDRLSIRRPTRAEVTARRIRQISDPATLEVHNVDIRRAVPSTRDKGQGAVIRRQRRLVIKGWGIGELLHRCPVHVRAENIRRSASLRCENHPSTIVGKRRVVIYVPTWHELARVTPVGVGDHQLRAEGHVLVNVDAVLSIHGRSKTQNNNSDGQCAEYTDSHLSSRFSRIKRMGQTTLLIMNVLPRNS